MGFDLANNWAVPIPSAALTPGMGRAEIHLMRADPTTTSTPPTAFGLRFLNRERNRWCLFIFSLFNTNYFSNGFGQ